MTGGAVADEDGIARCPWGIAPPEIRHYHDEEWGRPVGTDEGVFEKVCLEGFQAGLSWLTILRKREDFRKAFAFFDPAAVAAFGDADLERLLSDSAIVRNRSKIMATITNARMTLDLRERGVSLAGLFWRHEPPSGRPPRSIGSLPSSTPQSSALASELRREGFRFVGPTTVYAAMQALGVVNDHLAGCRWRAVVQAQRARFTPPTQTP